MKAEWDDAPLRMKSHHSKLPIIVSLMIVGSIAAASLYWISRPKIEPQAPTPAQVHQPQPQPAVVVDRPRTPEEQAAAKPDERQTVFNDSNYIPRLNVNLMESQHVRRAAQQHAADDRRRQTNRGLNGSRQIVVHWEDARGRRTDWPTSFTFDRNQIDNNSLCSNYRRGSIEYRTCRKGAREWLKGRCRSDRNMSDEWRTMYCFSGSNFRP